MIDQPEPADFLASESIVEAWQAVLSLSHRFSMGLCSLRMFYMPFSYLDCANRAIRRIIWPEAPGEHNAYYALGGSACFR